MESLGSLETRGVLMQEMMVAWSKVVEIQVGRSVVSGYFEGTPGRLDYSVQKTILRVLA